MKVTYYTFECHHINTRKGATSRSLWGPCASLCIDAGFTLVCFFSRSLTEIAHSKPIIFDCLMLNIDYNDGVLMTHAFTQSHEQKHTIAYMLPQQQTVVKIDRVSFDCRTNLTRKAADGMNPLKPNGETRRNLQKAER